MSDDSPGYIDTSGGMPAFRVQDFVGSILGILWWGYESGLLVFIDGVGDGIEAGILGLEYWISEQLFAEAAIPIELMSDAWAANAEFVAGLGPLGIIVAVIETVGFLIVASWLVRLVASRAISIIPGGSA